MKRHPPILLVTTLLWGCATYRPIPLPAEPDSLAPPAAALLNQAAATIDRPYLKPAMIDLAAPLDMNAIATLAVIANPDLKAQRQRAGISDAQLFAARLLPDPSFNVGASKVITGPDPFLDVASALGLDLAALRSRSVRLEQARNAARQVRLDLAWAEWQTAGQARIQAARIQGLERARALASASLASAQQLLDRSLRAAGRGDIAGDQVQAARIAATDAEQAVRTAERDLTTARLELLKLLGLPPAFTLSLAPAALPPPPPDPQALFALARDKRADLQALRAGYAAEEAAVHKAILDQFPTLMLTINGGRDTAGNTLIGPAVDFTLPLWNRNRGGIAVEQATRAALKAEYEARLFQTRAEIAAAVGGIQLAVRQRATLLAALPGLQSFAAATRRAADRGDLAQATAAAAEQAVRDKQALLGQSEQDIAEQTIALELLAGTPREAWPSGDGPSGDGPSGDGPSGDGPSGDGPSGDGKP